MMWHLVANGNLFGYQIRRSGNFITMCVLAVDVPNGGDPTLINRTTFVSASKCRVAEREDYDRFGYLCPSR